MANRERFGVFRYTAGDRKCKGCRMLGDPPDPLCDAFGEECDLDAKGRPLRLPACLASELPKVPSAVATAGWRALAMSMVPPTYIGAAEWTPAHALLEAADFVDAVRKACGERW